MVWRDIKQLGVSYGRLPDRLILSHHLGCSRAHCRPLRHLYLVPLDRECRCLSSLSRVPVESRLDNTRDVSGLSGVCKVLVEVVESQYMRVEENFNLLIGLAFRATTFDTELQMRGLV